MRVESTFQDSKSRGWKLETSLVTDLTRLDRLLLAFPELNLQQWTGSMYTWLTHPLLDPQSSGRVIKDNLEL